MQEGYVINAQRLRDRLKEVGKNQKQLAESLGIPESRVTDIFQGKRKVTIPEAFKMAEFLRLPESEIFATLGIVSRPGKYDRLPITGLIDATSGAIIMRADLDSGELEEVEAPFPGYQGCAVRIKGTSMAPRYREGEVICYRRDSDDIGKLLNREAIIETEDGRMLLKTLHRGSGPGLYTLVSLNPADAPIVDIAIRWASPIDFHIPHRG